MCDPFVGALEISLAVHDIVGNEIRSNSLESFYCV